MTMNDFKKFYYAEPFRPFVIRLANGEKLPIEHQHNAGFNPEGGTRITVALPKYTVHFDVSQISDVKMTPKRGSQKRRIKSGGEVSKRSRVA